MTRIHRRKKRKPTQFAPICFLLFVIIGIILYIRCIFIYFQQNNGVSGKGHNNGIGNGRGGHRHGNGNGHNHGHRNTNPYIADKDMERTKEDAMDNFLGLLQDKEDQQYSTSKNSATANNNANDANIANVANSNDKPVKKYTDREIYFQMIHKNRNRNNNQNQNLIQYQNVAIPSRIQKLYQTKQIIGQDGLHHVQHDTTPSIGNVAKVIEMRLTKPKASMEDPFRRHRRPKKEDSQYEYQHQHQHQPRKSDLDMKSDFGIPPELLNFKNKNESKRQSTTTTTTATTIAIQETISYLQLYLETLDKILKKQTLAFSSSSTSMDKLSFWDMYYIFTHDTLYSWDQFKYQSDIMPMILKQKQKQKSNNNGSDSDSDSDSDSIFVSVVSYKDDQRCANTLKSLFDNAHDANRIYVGLVYVTNNEEEKHHQQQQNQTDSNVNDNTHMDNNCLNLFCNQSGNNDYNNSIESENIYCQRNQIRSLTMNETISFSPYFARFFASKLWYGEQWYMQIDAHMHFQKDWDETSITMLKHQNSISKEKKKNTKAIISYLPYPYKSNSNHEEVDQQSLPKVCGGYFSAGPWDGQMIRLNTNAVSSSLSSSSTEENPFVVAGNLITTSDILQEVPFDPFLPFVSKGEEILMSSRLWTSGYDIFHPTVGVVSHEYGIQTIETSTGKNNNVNYIKRVPFWEDEIEQSLGQDGLYHQLQLMVLGRIKHLLNYPESGRDMIQTKSLLAGSPKYGLGTFRALKEYMEFAGIDVLTKKSSRKSFWCEKS